MRTRTTAGTAALAAGLIAMTAAGQPPAAPAQPPGLPPPGLQPPGTEIPGTMPLAPPAETGTHGWPKEIGGKDLKAWLADLTSPDPGVREAAVTVIPHFGPDARDPAFKPLLAALGRERDPGVRLHVIDLIGTIGAKTPDESKEIAKALAVALANAGPGGSSRLHLVHALSNYGPAAHDGIAAVQSVDTDPAWETRRAVAFALGRLGFATDPEKGPNQSAMKTLANTLLKDGCAYVRLEAAQALVLLGPPAHGKDPAVYAQAIKPFLEPVLIRQKAEKDKAVQIWLQMLVMRYDGTQLTDANVAKIADHLKATDPQVRYHALTALAMLGPNAKPFVKQIAVALRFEEMHLVYAAVSTLAALGDSAKDALPDLFQLKQVTKDEHLKAAAGEAIDMISGRKKPMAPAAPPAGKKS